MEIMYFVSALQIRVSFPVSINFIRSHATGCGPRNSSKRTEAVGVPRCDLKKQEKEGNLGGHLVEGSPRTPSDVPRP